MKDMKDMKEMCENKDWKNCKDCDWKDNKYYWMKRYHHGRGPGGGGAVYCLGFIGAAIYFIGHATTFWAGVLGFLQALVWPAFLVYEAFKFLIK